MEKKMPLNYVRTLRRSWAFTQEEIAVLLGFKDRSGISRIESGKRLPSLESTLALEVLFGVAPKQLFPDLYTETEEALLRRAYPLYEATLNTTTPSDMRKREALDEAMRRATQPSNAEGV